MQVPLTVTEQNQQMSRALVVAPISHPTLQSSTKFIFEHNLSFASSYQMLDWDEPFSDQELQAIEAAFEAATSSPTRKRDLPISAAAADGGPPQNRRRLPLSIPQPISDAAAAGGYPQNRRRLPLSILQPNSFPLTPGSTRRPMLRFPVIEFGGQILYSRTPREVERAAIDFLKTLQSKKTATGEVTIGLDIEWRASFRKGVSPGKAAVMQLCADRGHCHVMHIKHSGIPQSLRLILEDPSILKAGVGIRNDGVKVFKDYSVSVKGLEDLSFLANKKLGGEHQSWGLSSLTEMLISKHLMKPKKIILGNWETAFLSKEQLKYAATDAFASWYIYQVLRNLPDEVGDTADIEFEEVLRKLPDEVGDTGDIEIEELLSVQK